MTDPFAQYLDSCRSRIDQALSVQLGHFDSEFATNSTSAHLDRLQRAMAYSLLNGGKRVRPLLVYAAARAVGNTPDEQGLDQVACAVEMIHAYSLVHDDLPAMDDDDLRRGQPTCHRAFDEASAILAGDALQTRAFELLANVPACSSDIQLQLLKCLLAASGQRGMVGGQAIDLAAVDQRIPIEQLEAMHRLKTGALIRAAIRLGGLYCGATDKQLAALDHYGECIGLSFQVQDDILDIESDTSVLGKRQGADLALNKPTYPALLGLEGAKQKALELHEQAIAALSVFDSRAQALRDLSTYIISRSH